jgi:hypothetical protein
MGNEDTLKLRHRYTYVSYRSADRPLTVCPLANSFYSLDQTAFLAREKDYKLIPVNIRPIFSNRPRPRVPSFLLQRHNMTPKKQSDVKSYFLWKMNILLVVNVTDLPRYTLSYEQINYYHALYCLACSEMPVLWYRISNYHFDSNHLACQPLTQGRILIICAL